MKLELLNIMTKDRNRLGDRMWSLLRLRVTRFAFDFSLLYLFPCCFVGRGLLRLECGCFLEYGLRVKGVRVTCLVWCWQRMKKDGKRLEIKNG